MNIVIVGATQGMGRSLSRLVAARGDNLVVMARDEAQLDRTAADLQARGAKGSITTRVFDLADVSRHAEAVDHAFLALQGRVDAFVITAGMFATQDELEADPDRAHALCATNFAATVALCERVRPALMSCGGARTLVAFSSVAGDRGRKPVVIYGASKAGLSAYFEGLDHRFHADGLRAICVKPGFVKTGMTSGLKPPPFAGEPDDVAARVLAAIDRGGPAVVYAPPIWQLIMLVIKLLPRFVMRKIGF